MRRFQLFQVLGLNRSKLMRRFACWQTFVGQL
jgi:hypothetical protein